MDYTFYELGVTKSAVLLRRLEAKLARADQDLAKDKANKDKVITVVVDASEIRYLKNYAAKFFVLKHQLEIVA